MFLHFLSVLVGRLADQAALCLLWVRRCSRSLRPGTLWMSTSNTPSSTPCRTSTTQSWRTSGWEDGLVPSQMEASEFYDAQDSLYTQNASGTESEQIVWSKCSAAMCVSDLCSDWFFSTSWRSWTVVVWTSTTRGDEGGKSRQRSSDKPGTSSSHPKSWQRGACSSCCRMTWVSVCLCVCVSLTHLQNHPSNPLHTLQVCCCGAKDVQCRMWCTSYMHSFHTSWINSTLQQLHGSADWSWTHMILWRSRHKQNGG